MKVYETDEKVVISLKKSEIRFGGVYGDHLGFYLRITDFVPTDAEVALDRAIPARTGQLWGIGGAYNMWGK